MKHELSIKGFKCYNDASLELNNMTILIGANGAGKSSIIQSILLLKYAELHAVDGKLKIPMHNMMGIDFGQFESIIYNDNNENLPTNIRRSIQIKLDDLCVDIPIEIESNSIHYVDANVTSEFSVSILRKKLHYLDAERLGPRYAVDYKGDEEESCGVHGENTAYIWQKYLQTSIGENKRLVSESDGKFPQQLNQWIGYLFDGVKLSVDSLHDRALQVQIAGNKQMTNLSIGFGVSYALPILVEGLILEEDDTLIVENPEAHLQPKAQARMGYFLGKMAASGVRIIVETHSEHVIKGISTAIKSDSTLSEEAVSIVMISRYNGQHQINEIDMQKDITQLQYPKDFFDVKDDDILISETNRLKKIFK